MNNQNSNNKNNSGLNKEIKEDSRKQEETLIEQLQIIGIDNISPDLKEIVALLLGEEKMNELRARKEA
jgi:hypothetical protein